MLKEYTPEKAVWEWEKTKNNNITIIPRKIRESALHIADININQQRGITREDIPSKIRKDDKRGIIYRLKARGLIVPLPTRNKRLKQYVLSNLYNEFATLNQNNPYRKNNNNYDQEFDYGLLNRIAEFFSKENPGLHNIHLQTKVSKENYELLKGWNLNYNNKGKTKDIKLEIKRRVIITFYPNGTILIAISCNTKPFKLHNPEDLIEFFSSLGEIRMTLCAELQNNISEISPVSEWWLTQYDLDNTVAIDPLKKAFSRINIQSSINNVQIKLFGHLFYCYLKPMPDLGQSIRFEERVFPEKKPLNKGIKNVLKSVPPFKKAIDLLNEKKDE
jgi:hypothetical protein